MLFALELLGTLAFAVSGALVGIEKKMDVFGVAILAMTTAVGGGIIRDVILNVTPPAAFRDPVFALTAIAAGIVLFFWLRRHARPHKKPALERLLRSVDAVGLGLFTVVGVETAYTQAADANVFLAVFVGVTTGVGGGVLRDVLAGNTPYIFTKHFYACASLIGALVCSLCWQRLGSAVSMLAGALIVIVLRHLAARYRWSLPKIES